MSLDTLKTMCKWVRVTRRGILETDGMSLLFATAKAMFFLKHGLRRHTNDGMRHQWLACRQAGRRGPESEAEIEHSKITD